MLFNIWNPAKTGADEIRFDVTRANAPRVGSGDREWIAACLKAMGAAANPREWSITACRCYFYSDYTDEDEWLDRWPDTWIVRVKLDGAAPENLPPPSPIPIVVNQKDSTWQYDNVDPNHDRVALLPLLITGAPQKTEPLRKEILNLLPQLGSVETAVEAAGTDRTWLRITVTGALFPDRVDQLEQFLNACRQLNIIVNRNEMDEP